MPTIESITTFVATYWPAAAAFVALTTFVNQLIQRLPDRFARAKNISAAISADLVNALAEVGGAFGVGPRKSDKKDPPDPPAAGGTTTRIVGGLALLALLTGCASAAKPASCAPDAFLAEESARFQAAVLASCDRAVPLSHCAAYPALKADHDAKLEGWIACRK